MIMDSCLGGKCTRSTEIRHVRDLSELSLILESRENWRQLLQVIPKDLQDVPLKPGGKYNREHTTLLESASKKQERLCAEILFDEWGTSGKVRPTVGNLLDLLIEATLYRAADYVAEKILNEPKPERPKTGPAARVDISLPPEFEEMEAADEILDDGKIEGFLAAEKAEEILADVGYPNTSALEGQAVMGTNMNNEDFYSKIGCDKKKLVVEHSDLMKFSANKLKSETISSTSSKPTGVNDNCESLRSAQIPILSILNNVPKLEAEFDPVKSAVDSFLNEGISSLIDYPELDDLSPIKDNKNRKFKNVEVGMPQVGNIDAPTSLNKSSANELNIPNLSILDQADSTTIKSDEYNIPNLSALNMKDDSELVKTNLSIPILSLLNYSGVELSSDADLCIQSDKAESSSFKGTSQISDSSLPNLSDFKSKELTTSNEITTPNLYKEDEQFNSQIPNLSILNS